MKRFTHELDASGNHTRCGLGRNRLFLRLVQSKHEDPTCVGCLVHGRARETIARLAGKSEDPMRRLAFTDKRWG